MALVGPEGTGGATTAAAIEATFTAANQVYVGTGAGTGALQVYAGFEIAYDQITATVNVVSTAEGAPTVVIAGTSHTYENVPYLFHFYSPFVADSSAAAGTVFALLMQDAASIGRVASADSITVATQLAVALVGELRFTPTAGAHIFGISAFASSATGTPAVGAGVGGSGAYVPAFLRVTKC